MFIELVDALRCPNAHDESWLVAAARRMEARHIVEGTLGCPVCAAEYPIHHGVADFRRAPAPVAAARTDPGSDPDAAARLAAFLDLTDASGFAVLLGEWGVHATAVETLTQTPLLLVNPPAEIEGSPGISVLRCDDVLPLAAAASRGTALDDASPVLVHAAVRATRAGGRVAASVAVPVPDGVRELVRDEAWWVGEREQAPLPLLSLHVRRR
ncbi:MAG TPA: hypothetical protein VGG84_04285 [Gemmatimonadaceae bacterium]